MTETLTAEPSAPEVLPGGAGKAPVSPAEDDTPRFIRQRTTGDIFALVGSGVASFALDWLVYERILAFSGGVGFFICWYLLFLVFYSGLTLLDGTRALVADRLASAAVHSGAVLTALGLVTAVGFTYARGYAPMGHVNTYLHDAAGCG